MFRPVFPTAAWVIFCSRLPLPNAHCGWGALWPMLVGFAIALVGISFVRWAEYREKSRRSEA